MEIGTEEKFLEVRAKHSPDEALQRWRNLCSVVKNCMRRFRFTANLSKRVEAAAMLPHPTNQEASMALTPKPEQRVLKLYRTLTKKCKYVAKFYGDHPPQNPLQRHASAYGNTFFHMAIRHKQFELVDLLLATLREEYYEYEESLSNIKNDDGNTILHELAAHDDSRDMAIELVRKDPKLLIALNNLGETPIFSAARHGRYLMFFALHHELKNRYLHDPGDVKKCLERDDKTTLLHAAVTAEQFGLAHFIAQRHPFLITEKDGDGMTALQYLSCNKKAFERKEKGGEGFLEDSALQMTKYKSLKNKLEGNKPLRYGLKKLVTILVENDTSLLSIDSQTISSSETTEVESKHTKEFKTEMPQGKNMQDPYGRSFLEYKTQRSDEIKKSDESSLFLAIMSNIPEIVEEIFLQWPSAIKHTNKEGMNVLQVAILYGNIGIIDFIINFGLLPDSLLSVTDEEGNSLLHMVSHDRKGQASKRMQNPAMQLQKECMLFQEVKAACNMHIKKPLNNRHQTAEELFAAKNEKLHQDAKEWVTRTTESCTILSVFIATVAFAATYTVPGGPDQNTGIPLLHSKPWFVVFIVADVISLTLALASVGIFLSILTSSFPLQDFENSVFRKLRWGIISMVLSVSMMTVAFGATIVLAKTYNWESVVWIVVGFLPVPIFFLSYSPLRSAVLGPGTELLITFAANLLNWCEEIEVTFRYWYFYGLRRAFKRGFRRIRGQKSAETSPV